MAQLLKRFQTAVIAHDGFGNRQTGNAGNRHAVSGIALGVENGRGEAAEMWSEVARDVAFTAPRMLDSGIGKLWENFQHVLADEFGHAARIVDKLVVFAAEEQAAVSAEAVVVEDVAVVADGHIVADQVFGTFAQRLGGNDKGADCNGFLFQYFEFWVQTGISIDGINEVFALDATIRCMNQPAVIAWLDTRHRGLLKKLCACIGCRFGNA